MRNPIQVAHFLFMTNTVKTADKWIIERGVENVLTGLNWNTNLTGITTPTHAKLAIYSVTTYILLLNLDQTSGFDAANNKWILATADGATLPDPVLGSTPTDIYYQVSISDDGSAFWPIARGRVILRNDPIEYPSGETVPSASPFLNATGAEQGATDQAQDFLQGVTVNGGAFGISQAGAGTFAGISADTVAEKTPGAGVTVDGLLIKDGAIGGRDPATALLETGAIVGATSQAQVFTNGLTVGGGSNGIDASGALTAASVGIGITAPYATLQSVVTTTYSALFTTSDWDNAANGSGLAIYAGAASGNTSLRIQSLSSGAAATSSLIFNQYGGSVGVATTSPSAQLHAVNSNAAQPVLRLDAAAGQTANEIELYNASGELGLEYKSGRLSITDDDSGNSYLPQLLLDNEQLTNGNWTSLVGGGSGNTTGPHIKIVASNTSHTSGLVVGYHNPSGVQSYFIGTDDNVNLNFFTNGVNVAKFDTTTNAGSTRFMVYDVDNGTLERVSVGAADSGGSGYKVLRIPN